MAGKAESRLIYNSISTSERVASLGVKGALLFTWMITHADSQGRMQGKPKVVKHLVVPFLDEISVEDVTAVLDQMEDQKLIIRYQDKNNRSLIQVVDWWDWQTGLKYKAPSHYEPPPGWEDRVISRDEDGKFTRHDVI